MSNLAQRVLVALAAVPCLLALAYFGGFAFFIFVLILNTICLAEFLMLCRPAMSLWLWIPALVIGFIITLVNGTPFYGEAYTIVFVLLVGFAFLVAVEIFRQDTAAAAFHIAWIALGLFCITWLGLHLGKLRMSVAGLPASWKWVGLLFINVWISDTAAYFVGKKWGIAKIRDRISPKKSWVGSAAGLVASVAVTVIFWRVASVEIPLIKIVGLGLALGLAGQAGDFWESMLKRYFSIKDSSGLIPGHGGVLDRFDSLLFAAPTLYYFLLLINN